MLEFILQLRKGDEMGLNVALRLLALGLFIVLLFLVSYYFLVVNRNITTQTATISSPDAERIRQDAALASLIKSALAQTKRLQGYNISVENKEGEVTLNGDVPSPFDKELAGNVARETPGIKNVINSLAVVPGATPQTGDNTLGKLERTINVEDLELQANLRERLASFPELKNLPIEIKSQQRTITLTGTADSEQQRAKIEQIIRTFPKVVGVVNQIKVGGKAANVAVSPSPITNSNADQELVKQIAAKLSASAIDASILNEIKVTAQNGIVTLSGEVPTNIERVLAENIAREIPAVKSIKNSLRVTTK